MPILRFEFKVSYLDGREVECETRAKELIGWERHFGIPLGDSAGSIEHMYYMAWLCLFNRGDEPRNFDSFVEVIDGVEQLDIGEVPGPTEEDRPNERSSDSQQPPVLHPASSMS